MKIKSDKKQADTYIHFFVIYVSIFIYRKDKKIDIKVSSITLLNKEESKTKAMATLVINDEFAIHGIKVIDGKNGEFVQMPQKRDINGNYSAITFKWRS